MPNLQSVAPANSYGAVTKSDSTDLGVCRGISFGTAGDLVLTDPDGTDRTIPSGALAVGIIHPISYTKVKAATTAANMVWYK